MDLDKSSLSEAASTWPDSSVLSVASDLGALPVVVRYHDEYEELTRTIQSQDDVWVVSANGRRITLNFGSLNAATQQIVKHLAINRLHKNAITGAHYLLNFINTIELQVPLLNAACIGATQGILHLRTEFFSAHDQARNSRYFEAGKALLYYFADMEVAGWSASDANVLKTISSPAQFSKHRTVRDGSAIISFEEERKIVGHFDDLNAELLHGNPAAVPTAYLRDACILFWNYAHGVRPIQIANRDISHVRLRSQDDGNPIVHLTFRYAKQRGTAKSMEQTRKMKRDWTTMMSEWLKRRSTLNQLTDFDRPNSLFGVSPHEITLIVAAKTEEVTGVRRVPYDLRHSAAQRKADAGCSRVELAEFLMHQDIDTADAYIEMSPTQAEKINQALGLSPLFQVIDESVRARSVNLEQLQDLPEDMQIGGAPQGHTIVGIGGCSIGQSFCTKTPALACYGCGKFMYLRDAEVHRAVRDSVQEIVHEFVDAGRSDRVSPAYMQLREVLENIDAIVEELDPAEPEDAQ